ncbi:MmcQ/YjbR family DNA-binding protein [Sulfuriroseicoccus oceanibius]|uniref:MmcQ/YjbR family DNA-binding protein n=1 Tax=Sulfuriroseicoccus oceanibius TaxID=2707525 RepID=A0A6B3LA53_9BACT|nr:MmcQ/YjbR family DNA-binding protein [Sulfuriroseicoccus oceanibius]QQL46153.1 MmcQ/YjbR family DNA-binding protein [Sulfuriroseicoccus oceanibius]
MFLDDAIAQCLALPHVTEETPFGPTALVYKVGGKIFAITLPDDHPPRINLKCDPDRAVTLRDQFDAITPGYHMNKKHWNTVILDHSLPDSLITDLIRHSYDLVVAGLPKKVRATITSE